MAKSVWTPPPHTVLSSCAGFHGLLSSNCSKSQCYNIQLYFQAISLLPTLWQVFGEGPFPLINWFADQKKINLQEFWWFQLNIFFKRIRQRIHWFQLLDCDFSPLVLIGYESKLFIFGFLVRQTKRFTDLHINTSDYFCFNSILMFSDSH